MSQDYAHLELYNGALMPSVGLGLWKIDRSLASDIVRGAIQIGYRHLDAACDYGNETEVGDGIRRAISDGLCTRDELWITSKLWNTYHRPEHVRPAIERSLRDLGTEYLDLYLIHFPISLEFVAFEERYPPGWADPRLAGSRMQPVSVPLSETWAAMEEIHRAGLAKNIGICNFGCSLIRDLLSYASVRPAVLQVESHPYLVQSKLLRYCQQESIAYTAFSPLGAASYVELGMSQPSDSVLQEPLIADIASQHQKTPAQVVLRWGVQRGTSVIPKSVRIDRLQENLNIFDFELTRHEMDQIAALDCQRRFNDPGVFCESAFGCFFPIYE